jgi:hypothetical protein
VKKEELPVKYSDESKSVEQPTAQDDALEDAELRSLIAERKDQEEIEVDINTL